MKNTLLFIMLLRLTSYSQSGCDQYLNDFVPKSTDSALVVKLLFTAISPGPVLGSGVWDGNNQARADNCARILDSIYSHFEPAKLVVSGVANISDARIKFVATYVSTISPLCYSTVSQPSTQATFANPSYINIIMGTNTTAVTARSDDVDKVICSEVPTTCDIGTREYAYGMAHEIGHVLKLEHTVYYASVYGGDGLSHAYPTSGCCSTLTTSDYVIEYPPIAFAQCTASTGGNNFMGQNVGCYAYLSPQQMALLHYHLRTDRKDFLTSYSYNNHLNRNAASDYTVTTSETWTNDRYFKGHITVNPGVKLTIQCQLGLTQNARIFVKKTGQLAVDGGTITNISGQAWATICVEGDPAQDQSYDPGTGFATSQGVLKITNGGTLSKAGTAFGNYLTDNDGNIIGSYGGMILADNANFIDNSRSAEFLSYNFPSYSYFRNCQFKNTGQIGSSLTPFAHVSLWAISNIKFFGCNFEYAAGGLYANHGMGIYSMDAGYTVDQSCVSSGTTCTQQPSIFKNLDNGILVANINPVNSITVKNSSFETNLTGAYVHNMNYAVFDQNYFNNLSDGGSCGLYLHQSRYYTIKNNIFRQETLATKTGFGVIAYDCREGAHQVYRNNFGGLWVGIDAIDNNSGPYNTQDGLKMNCNDFRLFTPESDVGFTNQYDIAVTGSGTGNNMPSVKKTQGLTYSPSATDLVRNQYAASCGNSNKWYIIPTATVGIAHGCNTGSVTNPSPQPSCSSTLVNTVTFAITYTATDCPTNPPSAGGSATNSAARLANINSYLSDLKALGSSADTFELRATVAAKLNYFLTDSLPDSRDTVIQILTDNPGHMPDADIQLVYAYMNKGDFTSASTIVSGMSSSDRTDWAAFLGELIEIYQETNQVYSINSNPEYLSFMTDLANTDGKDGQAGARAILKFVNGIDYNNPYDVPEESEERKGHFPDTIPKLKKTLEDEIKIYPNPTQNAVTVLYNSKEEGQAQVDVKDLLGKIIYTNFINKGAEFIIPLKDYNNGIYIISISRRKELLYKVKLIKQE